MNQLIKLIFTIAIGLVCNIQAVYSQSSFKMVKKDGHYFTEATINGHANTPVFVETGFPGLTLSVDMYEKLLASLPLEEVENPLDSLRTDMTKHKVVKQLKGKVSVGDLTYDGFVFVVDPYNDKVTLPVNLLKNEKDTTACLIRFDFKKNILDYVRHEDVSLEKMHTYKLVKFDPIPLFESTMELSDALGHDLIITGNFNFDLGCGTSVFFYRNKMLRVLKKNNIKIQTATDKSLNVKGQGIYAGYCKIGEKTKTGFSIGITNNTFFEGDRLGCVGPSFFKNSTVILDPNNNLIYYK